MQTVYLAGGCLWSVQYFMNTIPGVVATEAGRANGKTDSLSSPAASKHISALDASDVLPVLDGLLTELRKVTDWSTRPQGLAGALLLASKFSEASASLKVFVRERDLKAPWFKALTKNFKWA